MKIVITGANGFIGRATCRALRTANHDIRPVVRSLETNFTDATAIGSLNSETNWLPVLQGVDCVVHCAARVHVMDDTSSDPLTAFRRVNVEGTARLAEQAVLAGVKRMVYLSSLKVLGEKSLPNAPFRAVDEPNPKDPYGQSKWEAEQTLRYLAQSTGLEVVVIRPPLVYGPGVKANFLQLINGVTSGIPLPLGSIQNQRSLVALDNLSDLIKVCVDHPAASGETFLVSDGASTSTPDLIKAIARSLNVPARLFPFPVTLLQAAGWVTGKSTQIERLTGSLAVDIAHTQATLGWSPPVNMDQQLQRLVEHLRHETPV